MKLLDLLLAFLRPSVDEPADDPAPDLNPDPAPGEPAAEPAPDLEADPDAAGAAPEAPSAEEFAAIQAAARADKERADRLEREMADLRGRAPQQPAYDAVTRAEEEKLNDPKTSDLERWQIQSNRTLREGRSQAQFALIQAQDVADRTNFSRLALTKPAVFKMYEKRVEDELAQIRQRGGNASREMILQNLIGRDALEGKLKPKKAAAKPAEETGGKPAVNRGQLPGARSDVRGKTSMTEHEKRRARLENVQI